MAMGKKRLEYDDELLVELIAEGQLSHGAIGERIGISESLVKKIVLGLRRRELLRPLWDVEEGMLREARRVGARFARNLVMEQVRLGLKGEGDQARRAREFVLRFTQSSRPRRKDLPSPPAPPRPEWHLDAIRGLGGTPWEDLEDAQNAREAEEEQARMEAAAAEKAGRAESAGNNDGAAGTGPAASMAAVAAPSGQA